MAQWVTSLGCDTESCGCVTFVAMSDPACVPDIGSHILTINLGEIILISAFVHTVFVFVCSTEWIIIISCQVPVLLSVYDSLYCVWYT